MATAAALSVGLAQINLIVGDIDGNARRVVATVRELAERERVRVVLLPELTLIGYPPDDLLLRPDLAARTDGALDAIAEALADSGVAVVVGAPVSAQGRLHNSAVVIDGGERIAVAHKRCLPNYGVFDEKRYFVADTRACTFELDGRRLGLVVCEDLWDPAPAADVASAGAEAILCINASPYHRGKHDARREVAARRASETGLPVFYVNQVGGQDDLVFDGGSFVLDAAGDERTALPPFEDATLVAELGADGAIAGPAEPPEPLAAPASIYRAIELGIRDYIGKNGFGGVFVGLSGGIDSALTLALAVDALGAERVTAVLMPSRYTASMSLDDAAEEADRLGVHRETLSIEAPFEAFLDTLAPPFAGRGADVTEENIQARCRGVLLMALANKNGALVLSTGNKSELAVGYSTLYGDMVGGYAPLKDVGKTWVYELARWRNRQGPVIPDRVLERAPSAELAAGQADTDNLPPYEVLDPILEALVERDDRVEEIVAAGYEEETVRRVARMLVRSEYKRRQAAPGPKVSPRAFGRERRYPITSHYPF